MMKLTMLLLRGTLGALVMGLGLAFMGLMPLAQPVLALMTILALLTPVALLIDLLLAAGGKR